MAFDYFSWCFPQPSIGPDPTTCCCVVQVQVLHPDLAIYSQDQQLAAGAAPTWLNPDIAVQLPNILITLRNNSPSVPALNGLVMVALAFPRMGSTPLLNGTQQVSLPAGGQTQLTFPVTVPLDQILEPGGPWDTPAVLVQLVHPNDNIPINNAGQFRRVKIRPVIQNPGMADEYASFRVELLNPAGAPERASFVALDVTPHNYAVVLVPNIQEIPAHNTGVVEAQVRPPPPVGAQITIACHDASGALFGGATHVTVQ